MIIFSIDYVVPSPQRWVGRRVGSQLFPIPRRLSAAPRLLLLRPQKQKLRSQVRQQNLRKVVLQWERVGRVCIPHRLSPGQEQTQWDRHSPLRRIWRSCSRMLRLRQYQCLCAGICGSERRKRKQRHLYLPSSLRQRKKIYWVWMEPRSMVTTNPTERNCRLGGSESRKGWTSKRIFSSGYAEVVRSLEDKPKTEEHRRTEAKGSEKTAISVVEVQIRTSIQIHFWEFADWGEQDRQKDQGEPDPKQHENHIQPQQRQKVCLLPVRQQRRLRRQPTPRQLTQNILQKRVVVQRSCCQNHRK